MLVEMAGGRPKRSAVWALLPLVLALAGCGGGNDSAGNGAAPDYEARLADAPPELASLHARAGELTGGGPAAFRRELRRLRGFGVVVNKWASWCGPCRVEMPWFQRQAAERGDEVAFLGVNSNDGRDTARRFFEEFPVPYPSFFDPDLEVAAVFDATTEFPATAFYDREGKLAFVRRGPYTSERQLASEIERYAQ